VALVHFHIKRCILERPKKCTLMKKVPLESFSAINGKLFCGVKDFM
jgi:hypothetical protein